jgi:ParB-like chromosome segregation protein Spo0J
MGKRDIVKVKIDDIKLNPSDVLPYQTQDQQKEIEKMAKRFQKEGQLKPIRLYDDYSIINGHLRFYAAKKLEWKEINATIEPRPEEI